MQKKSLYHCTLSDIENGMIHFTLTQRLLVTVLLTFARLDLAAHCQIPCGIYDDHARIHSMQEDGTTILKSVEKIATLKVNQDSQSFNQIIRWVNNKEQHAQNIIDTICNYFLTQRVKPIQNDYEERLQKHHSVIILATKAKQKADIATVKELQKAIDALVTYYPKG